MGRAKIAMEFIPKEKARNTTYLKRKKGLIKKAHEFSILCDVPICIIIYPYNNQGNKVPSTPEVYSFSPNPNPNPNPNPSRLDMARARDPAVARSIIDKYLSVSKEEKKKRATNLCDMFDEWNRRAGQELSKLRHKNARLKYPTNVVDSPILAGLNADQLVGLISHLDQKLELLRQRVDMIKGANQGALVPVYEPNPLSGFMIPNNYCNMNTHLMDPRTGDVDVKFLDQLSSIHHNHPFGNPHQACGGYFGVFDPSGFHNQATVPLGFDRGDEGQANLAMGGSMCYEQRSELVDHKMMTNLAVGGSTGFHVTLPSNVSFSW